MRRNGLMKRGFALLLATVLMFGEMDVRTFAEGEANAEMMEAETVQEEISETDIAAPSEKYDLIEIEDSDIVTVSGDNIIENSFGDDKYKDSVEPASASDTVNTYATGENIASGTYENITWVIDANGKLTVSGTGEFATDDWQHYTGENNNLNIFYRAPWFTYRTSIISAEINVTEMTNAAGMFSYCTKLANIDFSEFDTSDIENMEKMFYNCGSLTNLDLSGFETSKVTNMNHMFYSCNNLTEVDVSKFDTSNVQDMNSMFWYCNKLTNSNFPYLK